MQSERAQLLAEDELDVLIVVEEVADVAEGQAHLLHHALGRHGVEAAAPVRLDDAHVALADELADEVVGQAKRDPQPAAQRALGRLGVTPDLGENTELRLRKAILCMFSP